MRTLQLWNLIANHFTKMYSPNHQDLNPNSLARTGGGAGAEYLFKCNRWLDKREDDHRIERELFVEKPPPPAPAEIPEPSRNVSFNRTSSALSQQVGSPRQRERKGKRAIPDNLPCSASPSLLP